MAMMRRRQAVVLLRQLNSVVRRSLIAPTRSFHATQRAWKRDDLTPEEAKREIQQQHEDSYESTIEDFPGWSEVLASDSEAIVKSELAERRSPEELEEETLRVVEKMEKNQQYPMGRG